MEDQRQGASSSREQSKTTLNDLLDTLKLLEEEPQRLSEPKSYRKDKYSWIDEVIDLSVLYIHYHLLCSQRLHLYSKNSNIIKYYYNFK